MFLYVLYGSRIVCHKDYQEENKTVKSISYMPSMVQKKLSQIWI